MKTKEIVFFIVVLGVVFGATGLALTQNKSRKITTLKIDFENQNPLYLSDTLVNKMLIQKGWVLPDQNKDSLDLSMLESLIEETPAVANSEVFVFPDGQLGIRIKERKPFLKVMGKENYFLDQSGQRFELPALAHDTLPIVKGSLKLSDYPEIISLVWQLQNDPYFGQQQLKIVKKASGYQLYFSALPYVVELGQAKHLTRKINKLKAFQAYQMQQQNTKSLLRVNLAFEGQVVVTN